MIAYLIVNVILLCLLSLMWKNSDWVNTLIKLFLIIMTVWSGFHLFNQLGFIVAAPEGMRWF
jgi:hypothetical protein